MFVISSIPSVVFLTYFLCVFTLKFQEAGSDLCNAVMRGDTALLQRLIDNGVDPNSADYDLRTPLHIACAEGFLLIARTLVEHGADVFARDRWIFCAISHPSLIISRFLMGFPGLYSSQILSFPSLFLSFLVLILFCVFFIIFFFLFLLFIFGVLRWGNTPLEEAQRCGSQPVVSLIEEAMIRKVGGKVDGLEKPEIEGAYQEKPAVTSSDTNTTLALVAAAVAQEEKKKLEEEIQVDKSEISVKVNLPKSNSRSELKSISQSQAYGSPARSYGGSPRQLLNRRSRAGTPGPMGRKVFPLISVEFEELVDSIFSFFAFLKLRGSQFIPIIHGSL